MNELLVNNKSICDVKWDIFTDLYRLYQDILELHYENEVKITLREKGVIDITINDKTQTLDPSKYRYGFDIFNNIYA